MLPIKIIAKDTGHPLDVTGSNLLTINRPAVIKMSAPAEDIQSVSREGERLVIKLKTGETISIDGFFDVIDGVKSDLVFEDPKTGELLIADYSVPWTGVALVPLESIDSLLVVAEADSMGLLAPLLGLAAVGGAVAIANHDSGGGGGSSADAANADQGLTTPSTPSVLFNNMHGLTGKSDAGATVALTLADGTVVTTVADDTGLWHFNPNPLADGEQGSLQASLNGVQSGSTSTGVADVTAPAEPVVTQNNQDGLAGMAEPGSTITVSLADGSTVIATVGADGQWNVTPNPLTPGVSGSIVVTDTAGNSSASVDTGIINSTQPVPPTVDQNNADGLSGTGEPGSTVTVELPDGSTVTTIVDGDGNWSFVPNPLQPGEEGSVTITDPDGNTSTGVDTGSSDQTPPAAPTVDQNNGDGLSGTGEPGSTVVVELPDGSTVTTTVDENGNWSFVPNPLQPGEAGSITVIDPAGNATEGVNTGTNDQPPSPAPADQNPPAAPTIDQNNGDGLSGTGEPGSTVVVELPDGSTVTTVIDENGNWSFVPNPLQPGEAGSITVIDPAGNASEAVNTGSSDQTPPAAPTVDQNDESGISGTGEPGSTVVVELPDGSTVTTVIDENGNWSFVPNPLQPGEAGSITVIDPAGNTSEAVNTGSSDQTPPAAPTVDQNNGDGISGTGEPGSTVVVELPDGSTVTTVIDENGNWSFVPNPLQPGEAGSITVIDPTGNASEAVNTGSSDQTPPAAPTVDQNNGDGISGTGEPGSTVVVELPDGSTVTTVIDENGNWSFVPNPLQPGEAGSITVIDPTGNASEAVNTGSSDQTPPAAPTVDQNNESGISGTGEPGSTVVVELPDGSTVTTVIDENGNWSFVPNPLQPGEEGSITVIDPAGNASEAVSTGSSDQTPPAAPTVDQNNGDGISGTGEPGSTVVVELPDGSTVTTVIDENGNWSFVPNPLQPGEEGSITVIDPAGNASEAVSTGSSDQTPPAAPTVDQNNGDGISGTGEPGSTVVVELPDGSTVTTVIDENGNWSFVPNPLQPGEAGSIIVIDPTGNASEAVNTGSSDQTPPAAPTVDQNNGSGLSGTGEAGSTVTVELPDGSTVTTVIDENGNWSFVPNPLQPGEEGSITVIDPAGNASEAVNTGSSDQAPPAAPAVDQNNEADLSGTGEAGGTVTVELADGSTVTTVVDENGDWSFVPNPLQPGEAGSITITDAAGNISEATQTAPSDQTAPVIEEGSLDLVDNVGTITGTIARGDVTDDAQPEFKGSFAPDDATLVKIYDNGVLIGSAAVDASGHWSFVPTLPLTAGEHSFVAEAVDAAGNVSDKTAAWDFTLAGDAPAAPAITQVLDDVGTVTGALQKGDSTDDNTLTITGTGAAQTLVTVFVNGAVVGSVMVDASGNWSLTTADLGADGVKNITAQASDLAGQLSPMTGEYSVTLDTQAPTQPVRVVATDDQGAQVGPIAQNGVTDDAIPTFSGSGAESGALVKLYDNGVVIGSTTVDASGNWSYTASAALAGGAHAITTTLTDKAGNTSVASEALNFSVETGEVVVSIVKAIDNVGSIQGDIASRGLTDDAAPTLVGTATAGALVTVSEAGKVLGSVTADASGNWSMELPIQAEGLHTYTAVARNAAGTEGSADFMLDIDLTAPSAPVVSGAFDDVGVYQGQLAQNGFTDDTTPTLSGSGNAGEVVKVYDNGTLLGSVTVSAEGAWSFTPSTPLAQGAHSLTATQSDAAGNESVASAAVSFTVDTTAPTAIVQITAIDQDTDVPGDFITSDTSLTLFGTLSTALGANEKVQISLNDGSTWFDVVVSDLNWRYDDARVLTDGLHNYQVRVIDAAGNVGSQASQAVVIDTGIGIGLNITDITPDSGVLGDFITSATSIAVKGTLSQELPTGARVQVSSDGGLTWANAATTGTTWIFEDPTVHGDSVVVYQARVVAAGGAVVDSASQEVTFDTTAPAASALIESITEDRGASPSDFITNDNRLVINGSLSDAAEATDRVEVSLNGGNTWEMAAFENGKWSLDMTDRVLADGTYIVQARVVDAAGNRGTISSQVLTIDTVGLSANGMTSTFVVSTDTAAGVSNGHSTAESATNSDMVTRDTTVTVSGTLNVSLQATQNLQVSFDNGQSWVTVLSSSGSLWTYTLPEFAQSQTLNVKMQLVDTAGNVATGTSFNDYTVVVDLDAPEPVTVAPVVAAAITSGAALSFASDVHGRVESGALIALVEDSNKDGVYSEGLDKILGYATADAQGDWKIDASLSKGNHSIGFVVWDAAGNRSNLSELVQVTASDATTAGSRLQQTTWGGTASGAQYGLNAAAVTVNEDGTWSFFQSSMAQSSGAVANAGYVYSGTDNQNYTATYLAEPTGVSEHWEGGVISQAVFADYNRDGLQDIMSQTSSSTRNTALWTKNSDGTYTGTSLALGWGGVLGVGANGTETHVGGVVAYDAQGDGYLDFAFAGSNDSAYVKVTNDKGTLNYTMENGGTNFAHEISAVDVNNNGTVELAGHSGYDWTKGLSVQLSNADGSIASTYNQGGVFRRDSTVDHSNLPISMTWADFNGDGYLDLFISRSLGDDRATDTDESRIYLNLGNDANGNWLGMAQNEQSLKFGDSMDGGASFAVDWNHDGQMDVIEVPRRNATDSVAQTGSPTVYLNQGNNVWSGTGQSLSGTTAYDNITGATAVDYDWDGAVDLIMYRAGSTSAGLDPNTATSILVRNENVVADGTSLHLRILDKNGLNVFYGNTVKLYNSAGDLVATQIINPQSSASSNSQGLVNFYGLDASETYSVQLLRTENSTINHVGASTYQQNYVNGTVNLNWGGLTTGAAHDAYVLTAESTTAVNDTIGESGLVGTGYNDTFFGSEGNDTINGGGGWNTAMDGTQTWSATQGMDVVDYSRSTLAMQINLESGVAIGMGTDNLISIEGIVGSAFSDSITDSSANNRIEGGAGNDVIYLTNGGNDTLLYKVLDASNATGGNGSDQIYSFHVGNVLTDGNADVIDVSELLGYKGTAGLYQDQGVTKLDSASSELLDYLKVEVVGNDTVISVDRDGAGAEFGFSSIATLVDVKTDLLTLMQNHQLVV
ncbi:Ig-like domain-containing protein [Pseudomonas chlororaphis]|uniref:Ig-like domain-containing protein n=2 Tax=Pseudomonas chlororaphis TaxID=587753 RepID=UPI000F6D2524|nr:Ig-like domain-containing protein [Pseudomonas chlororaphis]AZD01637.1 T1SS secreted agglutinin RTX [Pseudomonas chlororaphis subsp. chlororaphis]WDH19001.1 Ig-like domain-containing protein [Pseudomonas chlororaphis]WDH66258.1 Ig-like domain-containing protein [Pseudomonas chlororaphis]SMQ10527.1 Ig-like domain (group 3) [Pseudomonas chlororaphis]